MCFVKNNWQVNGSAWSDCWRSLDASVLCLSPLSGQRSLLQLSFLPDDTLCTISFDTVSVKVNHSIIDKISTKVRFCSLRWWKITSISLLSRFDLAKPNVNDSFRAGSACLVQCYRSRRRVNLARINCQVKDNVSQQQCRLCQKEFHFCPCFLYLGQLLKSNSSISAVLALPDELLQSFSMLSSSFPPPPPPVRQSCN